MTIPHRRRLLTVAEIADHLRVSKMTIYRQIHEGNLRAIRVGRSFRIDPRDARAYLDGANVATEPYSDGVA